MKTWLVPAVGLVAALVFTLSANIDFVKPDRDVGLF
jgi:hypothetical protein